MASLSAGTFLMLGSGTGTLTYTKLCDITAFPDLGTFPEGVDATTLSDYMRKYIPGLVETGTLQFSAYLDSDTIALLQEGGETEPVLKHLAIWFGGERAAGTITPTGSLLKITFDGYTDAIIAGAGVNEVIPVTVGVTAASAFVYTTGA